MLIRGLSTPLRHRPQPKGFASQGGMRLFAGSSLYATQHSASGRAYGMTSVTARGYASLLGGCVFGWQGTGALRIDDGIRFESGQPVTDAFASANPDGLNRIGLLQSQGRRRCT